MSSTRNNQERLKSAPPEPALEEETKKKKPNKPDTNQVLSFAIPTEFVDLPSKGKYYPAGHALHGVETLEIRHMTAKEEDILSSQALLRKGIAIDRMLQSILVDSEINIKDLLVGDKNALTVAARISGYGPEYVTTIECPMCATKQEYEFDLEEAAERGASGDLEELADSLDGIELTENNTFLVELPKSGHKVELKMLTGVDEEKLQKHQQAKAKSKVKNQLSTVLTDTLKSIIQSVGEVRDRKQINQFVDMMPALDSRYLRGVYQNLVPNVDLTQEFACEECGHTQALEVPVTADFFWPKQ